MGRYAAMYHKLFSAQADAIDGLAKITDNLIKAHQEAEEMYLRDPEAGERNRCGLEQDRP